MTSSAPLNSLDAPQRIELEYGWEIIVDRSARMLREEAERATGWREARVGLSWNVQFEDLRDYMGAAWYRTTLQLPGFTDTRHVLLKFGAVDYFCEVFVNGVSIGTHEGGYTPFSFEITRAVHPGDNQLMIRVIDPPMDESQNRALFPEMMYNEIPHGKQNWYVQNSGIWQGVRLELCPSIYIERLDVSSQINGHFLIEARLAGVGFTSAGGALTAELEFNVAVYESSGRLVFQHRQFLSPSSNVLRIAGEIHHPRLWSPDSPALYVLRAELRGAVQYRRVTRFGFRSFEAKDGRLYLNERPFFMVAALDQDFYPETIHTPTSLEFVRDMMMKAKRLGINLLRCHLKVAHPVYLDVADELGMLIWTELPSWSDCWFPSDHFSTIAALRVDRMFWEILIRDWNHCCIVLQTIMNESWGINLKEASQRDWLRGEFDRIKGLLTPLGRLVIDNSPCEGNFHVKTDIEDFHQYYSMPDHRRQWDTWLSELASRPAWTFSPYGDAQRSGHEPLLVSEFGNWGLPRLPEQLPWWFDVSFGERGVTKPAGVLNRFRDFGFNKIFDDFEDLADETQWHQFISLKYEIESIRSHASLQGYVITGITDVHWEVNGLLDMWRNEKVFAKKLTMIQQPDHIACKLPRYCFYSGEEIEIATFLSHFSTTDFKGARVRWSTSFGKGGQFTIENSSEMFNELSAICVCMPVVDRPSIETLEIEVRSKAGTRLAENSYDLSVLPPAASANGTRLRLQPNVKLPGSAELIGRGYRVVSECDPDAILLATRFDSELETHLQNGGRALLIAGPEDGVPSPLKIALRSGTELDGRWFSNFNWIRLDDEPFASVGFTRILGFESQHIAPQYVIQGLAPEQFQDVLSGITYGWLNNNCALAVQMRVGQGTLIVTTFRFDQYAKDPFCTELLHSLVRYLCSSECQPTLELCELDSRKQVDAR